MADGLAKGGVGANVAGRTEINDCAICLEPLVSTKSWGTLRPCQHPFHAECLTKWTERFGRFMPTCPTCRSVAAVYMANFEVDRKLVTDDPNLAVDLSDHILVDLGLLGVDVVREQGLNAVYFKAKTDSAVLAVVFDGQETSPREYWERLQDAGDDEVSEPSEEDLSAAPESHLDRPPPIDVDAPIEAQIVSSVSTVNLARCVMRVLRDLHQTLHAAHDADVSPDTNHGSEEVTALSEAIEAALAIPPIPEALYNPLNNHDLPQSEHYLLREAQQSIRRALRQTARLRSARHPAYLVYERAHITLTRALRQLETSPYLARAMPSNQQQSRTLEHAEEREEREEREDTRFGMEAPLATRRLRSSRRPHWTCVVS